MTKLILMFLFINIACSRINVKENSEGLSGVENVYWIGDGRELPENDSLYYLDNPAPVFRKEFMADQKILSSVLYITAAGYYTATINGERVGINHFEPAWTDFSKRIYYTRYDLTSLIQVGTNCLGVTLGNGFYNPLPLRMWGHVNLRERLSVGNPVFIAKLVIEYEDGNTMEIITDDSWKFSYGPVIKNDLFLGEVYDARRELQGWESPGFDDHSWNNAVISEGPGGSLQESFFPPMQITQVITPRSISSCPSEKDNFIADMGVNFTGTYRIRLTGKTGDTITFRFGERIYEDGTLNPMTAVAGQIKREGMGGPGAPAIAWQTDSYIIGNNTDIWYSPDYTFHTYRYMEISGLERMPLISEIEGLAINSNVSNYNDFASSSQLINSIQEATERTFLANLISVQADCPAREKFGYGGDLNATSEAFIYNFDMQEFYRKTVYDWVDAMNDSVFVDTAPNVGIRYCGLSWESAFLITQYYLYLFYNDTAIVSELYDMNNKWMDKVARIHPEKIVNQGLSDHESLEPVPVQLTGTCHYLKSARIMQRFASVMGDSSSEEKYKHLAEELTEIIKTEFWDKPVKGEINRQTLFASLLYFDIVPVHERASALDSLLKAVHEGPSGNFNTGIFGTKYILEALSRYDAVNLVYDIVNNTSFPGWGYMIDRGATTIWETWEESDNTYSNCHPMFGSVSGWFFKWLGGIRPDTEYPGFSRFIISPSTPEGLNHVNTSYMSPMGQIKSNWQKEGSDICRFEIKIPPQSLANVRLQVNASQKVEIKKISDNKFDTLLVDGLQSGNFELGEGEYIITISPLFPG